MSIQTSFIYPESGSGKTENLRTILGSLLDARKYLQKHFLEDLDSSGDGYLDAYLGHEDAMAINNGVIFSNGNIFSQGYFDCFDSKERDEFLDRLVKEDWRTICGKWQKNVIRNHFHSGRYHIGLDVRNIPKVFLDNFGRASYSPNQSPCSIEVSLEYIHVDSSITKSIAERVSEHKKNLKDLVRSSFASTQLTTNETPAQETKSEQHKITNPWEIDMPEIKNAVYGEK